MAMARRCSSGASVKSWKPKHGDALAPRPSFMNAGGFAYREAASRLGCQAGTAQGRMPRAGRPGRSPGRNAKSLARGQRSKPGRFDGAPGRLQRGAADPGGVLGEGLASEPATPALERSGGPCGCGMRAGPARLKARSLRLVGRRRIGRRRRRRRVRRRRAGGRRRRRGVLGLLFVLAGTESEQADEWQQVADTHGRSSDRAGVGDL